jgi:hypothetical protein
LSGYRLRCPEAARNLLLDFEHPQIALSLIIVKGDGQVVKEGEHCVLAEEEALEQVARRGLLDPAALPGAACVWRIGREPSGQEPFVAGDKAVALGLGQAGRALRPCVAYSSMSSMSTESSILSESSVPAVSSQMDRSRVTISTFALGARRNVTLVWRSGGMSIRSPSNSSFTVMICTSHDP